MNLLHEVYEEVDELIGDITPFCIAGGAVRDYHLNRTPKDYDIFALNIITEELKVELSHKIASSKNILVNTAPDWHQYEPFMISDFALFTPMQDGYVESVKCQLMLIDYDNMVDLVEKHFDWNICQYAFDGVDFYSKGDPAEMVQEGARLELKNTSNALGTLRRGFRFSERYKMQLPHEHVTTLASMIIEGDKHVR